jgi:phosphatidylserine synthase
MSSFPLELAMRQLRLHIANVITLLGVVPAILLLDPDFRIHLTILVLIAIFADDIDGMIARGLNTTSDFGRHLDLLCDCAVHVIIVFVICQEYNLPTRIAAILASIAMIIRLALSASRQDRKGYGITTNEYVVYLFLVRISDNYFSVDLTAAVICITALVFVSLNIRCKITTLRRVLDGGIGLLIFDAFLVLAIVVPMVAVAILLITLILHIYSLCRALAQHIRSTQLTA